MERSERPEASLARNGSAQASASTVLASLEKAGSPLDVRGFGPRELVYAAGDLDRHLFFAMEGLVRIYVSYDGVFGKAPKQATTCLRGGGDVFGEPDLEDGGVHDDSAAALGFCRIVLVRKDVLRRHLEQDHGSALALLRAYTGWAEQRERTSRRLLTRETRSRLADLLLDLSDRFGEHVAGGVAIGARLTQQQLATMVASTRESVSREMVLFEREGAVETRSRGRIVLLDQRRLTGAAGQR